MDPPHPTLSPKGARAYPFFLSPLPVGEGGVRAFLVFVISERPPTPATPVLPPEGENLGTANLPPLGEVARSPPTSRAPREGGDPDPYTPLGINDLDPRLRGERGGEGRG
jgi:hypothetical protein